LRIETRFATRFATLFVTRVAAVFVAPALLFAVPAFGVIFFSAT
jgi:hypothetical protein